MIHLQDYEVSGGHQTMCGITARTVSSTVKAKVVTCADCIAPDAERVQRKRLGWLGR